MIINKFSALLIFFCFSLCIRIFAQAPLGNYVAVDKNDSPGEIIRKAANVTPSDRQYEWQQLEFTGFIHFGINTFDEVEWGKKDIDISKFNPSELDARQWVKVFKDAGIKLIILTAKHHDGFCLWPSKYTPLNISNTPFRNGRGDIVKELSDACREAGVKFGFYLSPWDMHEKTYGTDEYNTHFRNQLRELLTGYGDISEVWFDGANGEGPNGKKQIYDWQSYYKLIRQLQPQAVIAVAGPDVRWVGTESGYGRQTEWSVLPGTSANQDSIAANSQQQAADNGFIPSDKMDDDLGSREKILKANSLIWYPSEVDVSIRPGWFYKKGDDRLVKSPSKLVDIYFNSVGLNSVLLLNVPPDKRGLITDHDIKALQGMRYILDETFRENSAHGAKAETGSGKKDNTAAYITDDDYNTSWKAGADEGDTSVIIKLNGKKTFNCVSVQEDIRMGQRVEKFHLEWWNGSSWITFASATTIGYKRLLRFPEITADKVKLVIDESRLSPAVSSFGLYMMPPEITFSPNGASFGDTVSVSITSAPGTKIYYTLDGSTPGSDALLYSSAIKLNNSAVVTAAAVSPDGKKSLPVSSSFRKVNYRVTYNTMYDNKYAARGKYTLADSIRGSENFNDGCWQGFNGNDMDIIIDLKEIEKIKKISAGFLSDNNTWIFLPDTISFYTSADGNKYKEAGVVIPGIDEKGKGAFIYNAEVKVNNSEIRYIQIKAKNIGKCPPWHKGAGEKAWLFADEVSSR